MNKFSLLGVFAVMGCCFFWEKTEQLVTLVSPDGRNEIRLWTDPLAYEVARDGEVVVAKSEIGMKVDGECLSTLKRSGAKKGTPRNDKRNSSGKAGCGKSARPV